MSGRSITLSVEKLHYVRWVIEKVDNDKRLFYHDETHLQDIGIDGPTTMHIVVEGNCPTRIYLWERYWDQEM